MLKDLLHQFGLNDKEAALFLQIAHMGSAPASVVANKAHLKRTTCYQILEDLVGRGLVKRTIVANVRYYMAKTPTELERMVEKRLEELRRMHESLQANKEEVEKFYNTSSKRTEVMFYEGFDDIAKIYELMVEQEDEVIYPLIQKQSSEHHVLEKFWQWYRKARIERGKKSVSLVNEKGDAEAYIKQAGRNKRQVSVAPRADIPLFGDMKVCGDIVAILSPYKGRIWGVTIEDKEIADMFRGIMKTLIKHYDR